MQAGLTKKQAEALKFIRAFLSVHDYAPSIQEIVNGVNLKSKSGAYRLVMGLKERGYITWQEHRSRTIALKSEECPHCGRPISPWAD